MRKDLLMSWDVYNKTEHPAPYTFHIEKNNQHLFYFGSRHLYDPKHQQFDEIRNMWKRFLNKTDGSERIVMVEGGNRPVLETEIEAIQQGGEMHFVAYLAKHDDVLVMSPEPSDRERFQVLLQAGFSKEEIAYHEFARVCYQWNQIEEKVDFKLYVNKFLQADARESGWDDFDFTIEHMVEIHKVIFNVEFDITDTQFFYDIINPTTEKSVINAISRWDDDEFRDFHILEEIEKAWNEGKSLFVIYGSSHAVRHEPVIRDFIQIKF